MSQMDVEPHDQQAHAQENGYGGGSSWVELGGFSAGAQHHHHHHHHQQQQQPHPSPQQEYNGFQFMPAPPQSAPLEPTYHQMAPPVHPAHQSHHQLLRPLITPPWPSMLTSQSTYSPPILPSAPAQAAAPPIVTPTSAQSAPTTSPRRTLTDADRRRMCLYHEENPTVKQTEIGAMFGVERSTVSKVLRQKEKYLSPDDGSRSPVKRSKGRFPDIERALSNWARNTQKSGTPVTDAMIKEKARFFATTVGSTDSHMKITSSSWLEKFKQKNHVGGVKSRKNSEANTESDGGVVGGDGSPATHTPSGVSPSSPNANASGVVASPSPLSSTKSQDNLKTGSPDGFVDFQNYRLTASQSNTSLSSVFTDGPPSSFSAGPASPTSPFFSPDPGCHPSPFMPSQQARLPPLGAANNAYSRQRSQSFPLHNLDGSYMSTHSSSESLRPKYLGHAAMDAPLSDEMSAPPLSIDATISPVQVAGSHPPHHYPHLHGSSPSGPHRSASLPLNAAPSQDDARRALEVVMAFFERQPSGVDPNEYVTIGKLMQKLKLNAAVGGGPPLQAQPPATGLHRIQEEPGGLGHGAQHSLGGGDGTSEGAQRELHVGAGL